MLSWEVSVVAFVQLAAISGERFHSPCRFTTEMCREYKHAMRVV